MSKDAPWSLVHGDFHPANCMLIETDKADKVDQARCCCEGEPPSYRYLSLPRVVHSHGEYLLVLSRT